MSVSAGITVAGKLAFVTGEHRRDDRYMLALYSPQADLNAFTEAYSKQDECKGAGYAPGGRELQGYTASIEGTQARVEWTKETAWPNATITARGGLVYNARTGVSVVVLDISTMDGAPMASTNGKFTVGAGIAAVLG